MSLDGGRGQGVGDGEWWDLREDVRRVLWARVSCSMWHYFERKKKRK